MADPAMSWHTDFRWVGTWPRMPQPLPIPPADGQAPSQRRRIAQPVPSIAPAVPPRRPCTRWSSITSRPSSQRCRTPTPWAGASRRGWSATFATTLRAVPACAAASSPTGSRECAARTAGTTGSWPSPARVGGCARPATPDAWRRWRPTWPTRWSRTCPSASGYCLSPSDFGPSCTRRPRWRVPCSASSFGP
jgi:hypothetical protein